MDLQEIEENFEFLEDSEERFEYLIELGKGLPPFPDAARIDDNRVYGCQSKVWLISDQEGDRMRFQADSDAFIVRGLLRILLALYNDKTPQQVGEADAESLFERLGLEAQLTQGRRNGLHSMIKRIRSIAAEA